MKRSRWNLFRWAAPALSIVLLLGAWYARPLAATDLIDIGQPYGINVYIRQLGDSAAQERTGNFNVEMDTPEGKALLEQLESTRFHRSLLNPLRQFLPDTSTGRQTTAGDYNYVVRVFGSEGHAALQFFVDEWEYDTSRQSQYLPCTMSNGAFVGRQWGDEL